MTMPDAHHAEVFVDLDAPNLPAKIRNRLAPIWQEGWSLWQVPTTVRRGLIFKRDETSVEWWLLDENGDMLDAFWIKD